MADNHNNRNEYFEERAGTDDARFHVVPHQEEGWAVKREGDEDPEFTTKSKDKAVEKAKNMAKDTSTMVIIHDDDGQIEDQLNYKE
jgi:hypothetical protein